MKYTMYVVIEVESNNSHSVKNIEEALNFYWGSNGRFTVSDKDYYKPYDGFCKCLIPDFAPFIECQKCGKPPKVDVK